MKEFTSRHTVRSLPSLAHSIIHEEDEDDDSIFDEDDDSEDSYGDALLKQLTARSMKGDGQSFAFPVPPTAGSGDDRKEDSPDSHEEPAPSPFQSPPPQGIQEVVNQD